MGILWDLRKKAIEHQKGRKVQEAIELQQQRPPLVSVTPIEGSVVDEKCAFLDEMAYRMNYPCRGYALIINNKHFEPCTRLGIREGTDADAERLRNCLRTFGFKVLLHKDLRLESMVSVIDEMSNADHSNCDMFLCAILSHGDESCIYGTDESMCIDNVYCSFKYTRSLYGKPKMFIFQACRGSKCMDSISISYDATPKNLELHLKLCKYLQGSIEELLTTSSLIRLI
ncbi:hypothetical protein GJ496_001305 [Pomphorhynchus laevis]|nr:hypothetical protein GJ496_001305 [Pomphorhynchus laevis]